VRLSQKGIWKRDKCVQINEIGVCVCLLILIRSYFKSKLEMKSNLIEIESKMSRYIEYQVHPCFSPNLSEKKNQV